MKHSQKDAAALESSLRDRPPEEIISWAAATFSGRVKVSTGFGAEGVVVLDMLSNVAPQIRVFTLDTGRLPEDTYDVMERIRHRYGLQIEVYFPDRERLERLVSSKGLYSFRRSVEERQECCHVRKVEPLQRAMDGLDAWITGLRWEQAVTRNEARAIEWDETHQLLKINPLVNWTEEDVWRYIRANDVPYNALHERGYPSIGCAPCTRAIARGEHIRAGRWWWELPEHRECGIHRRPTDHVPT